jgi:hypothetical protein
MCRCRRWRWLANCDPSTPSLHGAPTVCRAISFWVCRITLISRRGHCWCACFVYVRAAIWAPHTTPRHCIGHPMDMARGARVFIRDAQAVRLCINRTPHVRPPQPNDTVEPQQYCGSTVSLKTTAPAPRKGVRKGAPHCLSVVYHPHITKTNNFPRSSTK